MSVFVEIEVNGVMNNRGESDMSIRVTTEESVDME